MFNQVATESNLDKLDPSTPGLPKKYGFNYRKLPFVWDKLNKQGITTGVYGMPLTYPAYRVDGWMVSGFPAPNLDKKRIFQPNELSEIVTNFSTDIMQTIDIDFITRFKKLEALNMTPFTDFPKFVEDKRNNIFKIIEKYPCDCYFIGVSFLDHAGHLGFVDDFKEIYKLLDYFIEEMKRKITPGKIIIVSDHGGMIKDGRFQHTDKGVFYSKGIEIDKNELHEYDITRHLLKIKKV